MIKEMGLAMLTAFALLGCASDSSDTMNDKKFVHILQDIQGEMCQSDEIASQLSLLEMHEFVVRKTDNETTCETYGKIDDGFFCSIESIGGGESNCVIGLNKRINDFSKPFEPEHIPVFKSISLLVNEVL
jgi:hypothetical protein